MIYLRHDFCLFARLPWLQQAVAYQHSDVSL